MLKHEVALEQGLIKQLLANFTKTGIALHFKEQNKTQAPNQGV